jgi:hypothetical protein
MKIWKVLVVGIFSLLLTCFLTCPCFAEELSTKNQVNKLRYNSKDITMAADIGMFCATEAMLKMIETKDDNECSREKIRKCIKNTFVRVGWKYEQ